MTRVALLLVLLLVLAVSAKAAAGPPKVLISSSNSGPGAAAVASVPAEHGRATLILRAATKPSGLPVLVEWTLTCPGRRHGRLLTHAPFSRTVKRAKGCAVSLQGQLWVESGKAADGTVTVTILGA